jgi:polyhydroxyalkanoate synthase subunit PhaC
MADSPELPPVMDPGAFTKIIDGFGAGAADPLSAYKHALDAWGQVLKPLAAAGRDKVNPKDRRFSAEQWDHPVFDLMRQGYQVMSDYMLGAAEQLELADPTNKAKIGFAIRTVVEAMSPANSPFTNPVALEKAVETKGQSLMTGVGHLLTDMQRGQMTHTDPDAFELGRNIACTPGKVVYQAPLFQLIQYNPSTEKVLETPLVIFPPWINRFYILDLTAEKSFIKWCVDQGVTVFVVSWKSADAAMRDIILRRKSMRSIPCVPRLMCRRSMPSAIALPEPRSPQPWRCLPRKAKRTRSNLRPSSPRRWISRGAANCSISSTTNS